MISLMKQNYVIYIKNTDKKMSDKRIYYFSIKINIKNQTIYFQEFILKILLQIKNKYVGFQKIAKNILFLIRIFKINF